MSTVEFSSQSELSAESSELQRQPEACAQRVALNCAATRSWQGMSVQRILEQQFPDDEQYEELGFTD